MKLRNPAYYKALRRNPRLRYSPHFKEFFYYYEIERTSGDLILPRGCFGRLDRFFQTNGAMPDVSYDTVDLAVRHESRGLQLRPYQEGVAEAAAGHHTGIFRLDTGFGKTIVALKVMENLGQKTLIIVPKLDLLTNFTNEYRKYFGKEPGVIQGKDFSIKDCTVATAQSLRKRIIANAISPEEFGAVICDECHLFVPEKTRGVVEHFKATYRFGFTATARRSDEQGEAIKFIFGDILIDRKMPRATPQVEIIEHDGKIPMVEYADMIEYQTQLAGRNDLIVEKVVAEAVAGRKILVLTKRVSHYERLAEKIEQRIGNTGVYQFSSRLKKTERDEILSGLKTGTRSLRVIFGTFSLLSTGIDIPSLDTLIMAGDLKSDVLTEQSAGRILRLFEGKQNPKIVDIIDTGNKMLANQARLRKAFYLKEDWQLI